MPCTSLQAGGPREPLRAHAAHLNSNRKARGMRRTEHAERLQASYYYKNAPAPRFRPFRIRRGAKSAEVQLMQRLLPRRFSPLAPSMR